MSNYRLKTFLIFLFIFGIGFSTSAMFSISSSYNHIARKQLIIGAILCGISLILYLIFYRSSQDIQLFNLFKSENKKKK